MPDNLVLYSPNGGSAINLGTWLMKDPGPDFGAQDLEQRLITSNARSIGGRLAFESIGPRMFSLPLILASGGAGGLSLTQLESLIRWNTSPGAYIDIQPNNIPSSEAIRFDIISGRWEPDYSVDLNRVSRRMGMLQLDVQPFGYFPTWMAVATGFSVNTPLRHTFSRASLMGDAPILPGRLRILPSANPMASAAPNGSYYIADYLHWAIANIGSTPSMILMGSGSGMYQTSGTYIAGDSFASHLGCATAIGYPRAPQFGLQWDAFASMDVKISSYNANGIYLEPGRYRAYGWLRLGPSGVGPNAVVLTVDAPNTVLASSLPGRRPVATLIPAGMNPSTSASNPWGVSSTGVWGAQASPNVTLYDLGEFSVTPTTGRLEMKIWCGVPSFNATRFIQLDAIHLVPVNGANAIVPVGAGGVASTTYGNVFGNIYFHQYQYGVEAVMQNAGTWGEPQVDDSIGKKMYGTRPFFGPSDNSLTIMLGDRKYLGVGTPLIEGAVNRATYELTYRPTFTFLKGL